MHWVVFNIPGDARAIPEGTPQAKLPSGTSVGLNDWKKPEWGAPCPPVGRHRYFFKLYALDTKLLMVEAPTKSNLERAMQGHILGTAQIIGTYAKTVK